MKNCISINNNYTTTADDYYIGVNTEKPIVITLLSDAEDGVEYVIKTEMKPPIGKRIVTIVTADESTIDSYSFYLIQVSHDRIKLFRHSKQWHII
jgi:hypothetical protein